MEKQNKNVGAVPDWIGNTPFPPGKKMPCKITEEMYVPFLYGFEGTQVENQVFVSTDKIFMAEWILPPGSHYEPAGLHLHGDEFVNAAGALTVTKLGAQPSLPTRQELESFFSKR